MKKSLLKIFICISALVFSNSVWGFKATANRSTLKNNFNKSTQSVSWTGNHVTFTLSGNDLYTTIGYLYMPHNATYTLSWSVEPGYDIIVKTVAVDVDRASGIGYKMTVGNGTQSEDLFKEGNIPEGGVKSGTLNYGNTQTVSIVVCKAVLSTCAVKSITIEYNLKPQINVSNGNVEVTICPEAPKTIDLNTCITNNDNHLSYTFSCTAEGANIEENTFSASRIGDKDEHLNYLFSCTDADADVIGTTFSASQTGTYTVNVAVGKEDNCHEAASTSFTVTVTPAALALTAPTASDITYRQTFSVSDPTGGSAKVGSCDVAGKWAWKDSATTPPIGDNQSFPVVFTPFENAGNYTNFETTATINVKRAQFVFDGGGTEEDDPKPWCYAENWAENQIPGSEDQVLIDHNVVIRQEVSVYSVTITEGDTLTIMPTGGLTVGAGGIIGATTGNLILKAGTEGATKGQTGYLRISPEYTGAMPQATVELFSIGYYNKAERETQKAAWQVVGAPIADAGVAAKSVYTKSWIYSWDEATNNWVNNRATLTFSPFVGYETTQYKDAAGMKLSYTGTLVSGAGERTEDLTFSTDGYNALANSYAAPIDISRFSTSDFINAEPTISVLNTGTQAQSENPGEDVNAPGKFLSIPVANAAAMASTFGYPLIIPSMQGFFVQATGNDAKIKLDYNRLVWNANYSGLRENRPLRAPKNANDEQDKLGSLKVTITANGWSDHVYILESENYDDMYESGYDARKMMSGDMDIYTINGEEQLSVDATNSIVGTRVGVRTGAETAYTFVFSHLQSENGLALYDAETEQTIDIDENTEYTFFAAPETEITNRFQIVARADAPAITTGVDGVENEAKAVKFIKDDQIYILKNGVLYNAMGAVVR